MSSLLPNAAPINSEPFEELGRRMAVTEKVTLDLFLVPTTFTAKWNCRCTLRRVLMTEQEWNVCQAPLLMLEGLDVQVHGSQWDGYARDGWRVSERKMRLWCVACWELFTHKQANGEGEDIEDLDDQLWNWATNYSASLTQKTDATTMRLIPGRADLLRHIVGNPFKHPILSFVPATPQNVTKIAQAVYDREDCGFALADALMEAGAPADFYVHFLDHEQHPKGCWALDLILGKS